MPSALNETLIEWPSWPKINTEVENAVSDFLRVQSLIATEHGGAPAPHGER
ncbi:hypothetical protein Thimo_0354 [Thioflavicoccus mobilis 8321]|uniref:Uncharacterized protein n=1 Tax=Thioflavicoccus mobilis 8321 TaxID=765912 RepID=L0GR46_9GAMM|nr:hypothetical protein Thimo_0354 [Thioflavicoccus mobilis 8321]